MWNIAARFYEFWRRATTTRYGRGLEIEVARLRAENRALLNSILGISGLPPVLVEESGSTRSVPEMNARPSGITGESNEKRRRGAANTGTGPRRLQQATPVRGRSWRQISRILEIETLKKMRRETDNGTEIAVPTRRSGTEQ